MSIEQYLMEKLGVGRKDLTATELKNSKKLTDTLPKLKSNYIIDDSDIDESMLGEYVNFSDEELNHFKTKSMIPADKITPSSVMWDWHDEHSEDYIVTIKKRRYGGDQYVFDVEQLGDAEITNKDNPHQSSDRDVFSVPFKDYDFQFVHNFLKDLAIFE